MSRKQELYLMLLATGTVHVRNQQSNIKSAPWWRLLPRRWRRMGEECYEIAELLHHIPVRLLEEGFTDSDFWFLNGPARSFFQRAGPRTSRRYGLFLSPMRQLFALVPKDFSDRLGWLGPELPEMTPERRAVADESLFWAVSENENIETLRHALASGADPNSLNDRGETPLMIAERLGKVAYIEALKGAGTWEGPSPAGDGSSD